MKKHQLLSELGIKDTAIKAYLYLLENKKSTVLEIARGTGIARTNIYHSLDSLKKMGLIVEAIEGKKKYILPESPTHLHNLMEHRKSLTLEAVELLQADFQKNKYESKIKFNEGTNGYKTFINYMLKSKENVIRQYMNYENLTDYKDKEFSKKLWKQRAAKNLQAKILVPHCNKGLLLKDKNFTEIANIKALREIRLLPSDIEPAMSILTFDNTVQFFAPSSEGYMFSFESPAFTQTIKNFFDSMWKISNQLFD